jgi:uncharacterized membrane protein HdeD (DUF308 family)
MTTTTSPSRGHLALRGLVAGGLGLVLMAWPGITIGTVIALFAIALTFDAVASGVAAFRRGVQGRDRVLLGLRAVIELVAAGVAIAYPGATASIMAVIAGIYAITAGGLELAVAGRRSQLGFKRIGWDVVPGVLAIMTGIALVVWPGIGAVTLAIVFGAYLAVSGGVLLVAAAVGPRKTLVPVEA